MNTKADSNMWWVVIGAVMALTVLAAFFFIFKGPISGASSQIDVVKIQQSRDACKNEMDKPTPPSDEDKDGFPDNIIRFGVACDLCWSNQAGKSDDNIDNDGDGVPDACDKYPTTPMGKDSSWENECNYDKEKKRCNLK